MNEIIDKEVKPIETGENSNPRVSLSVAGEPQLSPEQMIVRGEGSGKLSVCQKI